MLKKGIFWAKFGSFLGTYYNITCQVFSHDHFISHPCYFREIMVFFGRFFTDFGDFSWVVKKSFPQGIFHFLLIYVKKHSITLDFEL